MYALCSDYYEFQVNVSDGDFSFKESVTLSNF